MLRHFLSHHRPELVRFCVDTVEKCFLEVEPVIDIRLIAGSLNIEESAVGSVFETLTTLVGVYSDQSSQLPLWDDLEVPAYLQRFLTKAKNNPELEKQIQNVMKKFKGEYEDSEFQIAVKTDGLSSTCTVSSVLWYLQTKNEQIVLNISPEMINHMVAETEKALQTMDVSKRQHS